LPALRQAFLVGDVLTAGDVAKLCHLAPNLSCVNLYGSTESQRAVGYYVVPEEIARGAAGVDDPSRAFPLGRGMPDVQLLVLNRAMGLAGIGEVGEIYLRSPHLARGYLGDEDLTGRRFLENPWGAHRPGDRQLVAFVVGTVSTLALRRVLRSRLPEFMIPARFVALQELPRTPTRKLDRTALGRLDNLEGSETAADLVPPRSATEVLIAEIWCAELGLDRVSVHDNFFDLGGHSLQSVVVIDRLQKRLKVQILLRDLYLQTLRQLATSLDAAVAGTAQVPEHSPTQGSDLR